MMRSPLLAFSMILASGLPLAAENEAIVLEAENASLGAEMTTGTDSDITYATVSTNYTDSPGSSARVMSFNVTFPAAGEYRLYARIYVGPGNGDDDSIFMGSGFGELDATTADDWTLVNGLWEMGFSEPGQIVYGSGTAGVEEWKWVDLESLVSLTFTVSEGALTRTFQLGGREDGLLIDKIAFGLTDVYYTCDQLNQGLAGTSDSPPEPYEPLHVALATGKPKFLGNIWNTSIEADNWDAYWNQVTPENAGKWGSVEATRDVYNWTNIDAAYTYAKTRGIPFRFHVLTWGSQQPTWLVTGGLTDAEKLEEIGEWMDAVAARYPDIDYLEVTNEALHQAPDGVMNSGDDGGDYVDALGGKGESGYDWIINVFQMARDRFPASTKLMINEYGIIDNTTNISRYLTIINLLKAENLIDVIGFQAHSFNLGNLSAATVTTKLDLLATAGLPIMVTELDLDGIDNADDSDGETTTLASDAKQLTRYQRVFPALWEHDSVIGITLWGYRTPMWRDDWDAHLAYQNGAERPALRWLKEYIWGSYSETFDEFIAGLGLDAGSHGFDADADLDGQSTGLEYLQGTDPASATPFVSAWQLNGANAELLLPINPEVSEGYLTVETSTDLSNWATVASYDWATHIADKLDMKVDEEGAWIEFSEEFNAPEKRLFMRLRFVQAAP